MARDPKFGIKGWKRGRGPVIPWPMPGGYFKPTGVPVLNAGGRI